MTDETARVLLLTIREKARSRVPEWQPWMTVAVGWGGLGRDYAARAEKLARDNDRYARISGT